MGTVSQLSVFLSPPPLLAVHPPLKRRLRGWQGKAADLTAGHQRVLWSCLSPDPPSQVIDPPDLALV